MGSLQRDVPKVTKKLLGTTYAPNFHEEFLNKKPGFITEKLNEYRNALSHPFTLSKENEELYFGICSADGQAALAAWANMLERVAHEIIAEEIRIFASLQGNKLESSILSSYFV